MPRAAELASFLAADPRAVYAEVAAVRGSSPREAGAFMLIGEARIFGTIGGGALEHLVIERARQVLREERDAAGLEVALGPEIGQCCGGRVNIVMRRLDKALATDLAARIEAEDNARPDVFVFGAGHVGKALARALVLLPLRVHVIDTRPSELVGLPDGVKARAAALPEAVVRSAPPGSAFVIVTHDHALDFLIAREALGRDDSPYVGMVGSRTKRAKFLNWYVGEGGQRMVGERLVLPIGGSPLRDKRPEVIAALTAAELMVRIGLRRAEAEPQRAVGMVGTGHGR